MTQIFIYPWRTSSMKVKVGRTSLWTRSFEVVWHKIWITQNAVSNADVHFTGPICYWTFYSESILLVPSSFCPSPSHKGDPHANAMKWYSSMTTITHFDHFNTQMASTTKHVLVYVFLFVCAAAPPFFAESFGKRFSCFSQMYITVSTKVWDSNAKVSRRSL